MSSSDDAVVRIQSEGTDATDDARLEIKTTNGTFTIQNDRSLGTSGALTFAGNTSNNLVIDHEIGNVGIGTASPLRTLHTHVSDSGANYHQFTNSTTGAGANDGAYVGIDATENLILWNQENNKVRFATNNTDRGMIHQVGLQSLQVPLEIILIAQLIFTNLDLAQIIMLISYFYILELVILNME